MLTNADEMNVIGNIQMNPAELAASTDFTDSPMNAWIQLNAHAKASSNSVARIAFGMPPSRRNPTGKTRRSASRRT